MNNQGSQSYSMRDSNSMNIIEYAYKLITRLENGVLLAWGFAGLCWDCWTSPSPMLGWKIKIWVGERVKTIYIERICFYIRKTVGDIQYLLASHPSISNDSCSLHTDRLPTQPPSKKKMPKVNSGVSREMNK